MDYNFNLNQSLNTSNGINMIPQDQNSTGTSMWIGNYPSIQQLQQMNAQMGNLNIADTGTNYLDAYLALSQNGLNSPVSPLSPGPFYVASVQPTLVPNTTGFPPTATGSNTNIMPGAVQLPLNMTNTAPATQNIPSPIQPQPVLAEEQLILLAKMQRDALAAVAAASAQATDMSQVSSNTTQVVGTQTMHNLGSYEDFANEQRNRGPKSRSSSHSESAPQTPKTPRTPNGNSTATTPESRRAINHSFSETNSTASSTSVPGSPTSSGGIPYNYSFSEENSRSSSLKSPTSPRITILNEEPRSPTPGAIVSRSLSFKVKYPQDKCYKCMKKVYPMEKIGPIKDVVYHKGCFACKTCGTRLNLKNFYHSQGESYDINVYCKSHQPESAGKGGKLDSDSVLIKGAMSVPKLDHVNEQIRGDDETHKGGKLDTSSFDIKSALNAPKPEKYHCDQIKTTDNAYHYDLDSVEIAHARNVPVRDLQASNKLKHTAWRKDERDHESVPPPDVVRYNETVPEYDLNAYERLQVENNPDYDRR